MNRKTGVILSYVLLVVEIFSTLLFTPFLIRTLGQAEYGIYQLVLSITAYLALLDLGVGNSVIRYIAKYRANNDKLSQRKFLGITTIYYSIIAVVVLIVGGFVLLNFSSIFAKGLSDAEIELAKKLFTVTIIGTAFSLATSSFSNVVIAYERFSVSKGTTIILTIVKILVSALALAMGMGSLAIVVIHLLISVIARGIYICYVLFKLKIVPLFKDFDFKFIKEVATYSSFILLQMIAGNINGLANQVLLGIFAEGAAVIIGIYGIGAQILQYFKTLGSHFTSVLMPGLVKLVESGADSKAYEKEMIRISRIVFMALSLVWVVFAVNGQDFVILWAGVENSKAYYVALVLMLPQMMSYVQGVGYQLLQAMAKHKIPSIITSVSAIINVTITIILIHWNPLAGAVIGGFIALFLCEYVVMTFMYKKLIGIRLTVYYKGMFKGTLPCILVTTVVGVLFRMLDFNRFGWLGFVVNCGVMLAIYGVTMLLYGMNDYEKNLIFKPLKKILKKFHIVKEV